MKTDLQLLKEILNYCLQIEDAMIKFGNSIDDFYENIHYQNSCCFSLFQIGECVKKLSFEFINMNKAIPWGQIAKMRDRIGHGYDNIDLTVIWRTASEDVPILKKYCEKIIDVSE